MGMIGPTVDFAAVEHTQIGRDRPARSSFNRPSPFQMASPIGSRSPTASHKRYNQAFLLNVFTARDLISSHPSGEIALGDLKRIGGVQACKQIKHTRDEPRPSGLVAGPKPGAVVSVEILVEQNVVLPMGVFLKLFGASVDRPLAVRIAHKDARQAAGKLFCYLEQRHVFSRTRRTLDLKVVPVELIEIEQCPEQ